MAEIEKTMEINPYDHLIEPEVIPVESPVIFGSDTTAEKNIKYEKTEELIPLASNMICDKVQTREYKSPYNVELEIEEDLLVPDIEPDMETILNIEGKFESATAIDCGNGVLEARGKIRLETMYRSSGQYSQTICVIPGEVQVRANLKELKDKVEDVILKGTIPKIEYRIINERKYRVKLHINLNVQILKECEYQTFEGIKDEPLQLKKEKIRFCNLVSIKNKESEVDEELLLSDDKIRPLKILKYRFVISENHRQLTKEKLILNQTIWVRILYMAEIASKGNLSNQPMLYEGKIDHTQFIAMGKTDDEPSSCTVMSNADHLQAEINNEMNGFRITGSVHTEIDFYNYIEKETVIDFYHLKEEVICDRENKSICSGLNQINQEHILRDNISLQQEKADDLRIVYMDAQILEKEIDAAGTVRGKIQLEAVSANEGDFTVLAKKISEFTFNIENAGAASHMELENIFVREMTVDISGDNQINVAAHLQAQVNIYEEMQLAAVGSPCIIRSEESRKTFPITVYTVKNDESLWDIAKYFKVSEENILRVNSAENIRPGKKIIIVK